MKVLMIAYSTVMHRICTPWTNYLLSVKIVDVHVNDFIQ